MAEVPLVPNTDHSTATQAAALAQAWVTIELYEANPRLQAFAHERALLWLRIESGVPFELGEPGAAAPPETVAALSQARPEASPTLAAVPAPAPDRVADPMPAPRVTPSGGKKPRSRRSRSRARGGRASVSDDAASSRPNDGTFGDWRNLASFVALAFAWGTSFMFIKYGLRGFTPATLVCIQSVIAAVLLWGYIRRAEQRGTAGARMPGRLSRRDLAWLTVLAPLGYWAIVWGEQYIDSGVAAILTATEPLWTLVILRIVAGRADSNGRRMAGMLIGLLGVGMLGYGQGTLSGDVRTIGLVALLMSALLYSGLAVYVSRDLAHVWYIRTAAWSVTLLAIVSMPLAIMDFGDIQWRLDSVLAVVALGIFDSALGYLLFYRLVRDTGPTRAAQVNYLLPVIAVLAGSVFLGEQAAMLSIGAMLLILIGVWMGSHGNDRIAASTLDEDSIDLMPVRDADVGDDTAGGEAHGRRAA